MTLTTSIEIDLPEGLLECEAYYDDEGGIDSVKLGKGTLSWGTLIHIMGDEAFARIETLDDQKLKDLRDEAAGDAADEIGDHKMHLRMEDGL